MNGKICMVTGATSGMGFATARRLAAGGGRVVVVGRTEAKARDAASRIAQQTGSGEVEWLGADFEDLRQVRALAGAFLERHDRLDVLVNNAGATYREHRVTPEDVELTLSVNHLAPFLLTNLLLDALNAADAARVVNVSSVAHEKGHIDFDDLAMRRGYRMFPAYARSKLANVLFTNELARRLGDATTTVNAVHPGLVRTDFGARNGALRTAVWHLIHLRHRSLSIGPEEGADPIVRLASSADVAGTSGAYFSGSSVATSSPESRDATVAERLWTVSERLVELASSRAS
jgi:NAD(P)-dependent dehydrogenase (short-subunit alcohol dehydrogenase family)